MKEEPLARFVNNPDAGQQQQAGFDEGREAFDFAMTVLVLGVGRLVGDANREVGHRRGHQIEAGVRRLGQNAQAAGGDPDHYLHQGDGDGSKNGIQSDRLLLALHASGSADVAHISRLFTFRDHPPTALPHSS